MSEREHWRAAMGAMAAMSGAAFASGRMLALFFGQLKSTSWIGIAVGCALAGWIANRAAPQGRAPAGVGNGLGLLLAALVCAAMLSGAGQIGALALPLRHGYAFGALFALLLAALLQLKNGMALPHVGAASLIAALTFYIALALDPRPARLNLRIETELLLANSIPHALLLGIPYGALAGCVGHWGVAFGGDRPRSRRVAITIALALGSVLCAGNLALSRGGDALLTQRLPWVILSARWGLAGFWLCAAFVFLCDVATLAAAIGWMRIRWHSPRG